MKRDSFGRPQDATATQPISHDVLKEKYLKAGESGFEDVYRRVARALASVEAEADRAKYEALFLDNLHAGAIGAGRIMSAAGTDIQATLINCFVQPVGDCIQGVDDGGYPGIYEALREAAETMRRGGGVGYDFSRIRPRGAEVKATASVASGPCSYINVFDQSCSTVESAGSRRGAQMGVLRIDHPDVMDFITAKRTPGRWNNFNVSVGVPDTFMQALGDDQPWELVHRARPSASLIAQGAFQRADGLWVYQTMAARELWDTVMKSAYDFAEPGILFLDHINLDNNLRYCEAIAATNPCGEQPLPPYGCCDLGPIILTRFVRHPFGFDGVPAFDFESFERSVALQVRALDNVLDVTFWPLQQQREESAAKRRIGVGFTGMGNALAMLCLRYDAPDGREMAARIAARMRDAAYAASVALAREKGTFPKFEVEGYLGAGTFASRLPGGVAAGDPCAWHSQQPPAVDRPDRDREPGLCRQRLQWHRACVLLDVPAQEARIRRQHDGIRGGRPRLAAVP
jgi:ribonucleoside-diphosphate reductase alpha chain